MTYYQSANGPMSFCAKFGLFDNVTFDVIPVNTQGIGQTEFRHCKVDILPFGDGEKITGFQPNIIPNSAPYFTTGMEYIVPLRGYWDSKYGSITRKKINRTINRDGFGTKDAQLIYFGSNAISNILNPDNANGYASAQFTLSTSSDEFKMLQVGDNLLTQDTDEFGRANVLHQFGTVVSKNGSTGVVTVKQIPYGLTTAARPLFLFRPHKFITAFAMGNITSGVSSITGVIIEGNSTQLPTGITLNSPFFPEGTVLLSYNGAGTITTSNPANATKTGIDIISSDWQTTDYGVLPDPAFFNLGYKFGDIIFNIRPDLYPDVLYWVCTSSGIFGTATLPTFRAFTKQQPPQLVDNAAADALAVTFYYNTTSSVHRFKNGGTWYDVPTSSLSNPMTTQGDIIAGGASGVPTRVGASTGLFLKSNGTGSLPSYATPDNIYNADGTLTANRNVVGAGKSLNLGTGGSNLSSLVVNASGSTFLFSGLAVGTGVYSGDAASTIPNNDVVYEITDGSLTANRTITMPSSPINGTWLVVINKGQGSFNYVFGSTITDNATGVTFTTIAHQTAYLLHYDASLGWRVAFKFSAGYSVVNTATDANYTVTADDEKVTLPTITANRTITLPSAATFKGRTLTIRNVNSTGFSWQFSTAVKDGADASVTTLVNDTVYRIYSDGTTWNIEN
jgi:hypothetical protein